MAEQAAAVRPDLDQICVNTLRTLSMDAVEQAKSGHPGAPMGLAGVAYVLWTRFLSHNPAHPQWPNRDRFVLSGGHASILLYSLLYLTGYDVSLDDLKAFRQWGSKTPGHPEYGHTPGVETTTGPLGQGIANAVGMAMAERHLAAVFNRPDAEVVNHFTYVMCGDGDLMEGISAEAASLAGHLGLGRLICIYDDNGISIEGSTDITFTEDVGRRFSAYNWQVIEVEDGNDLEAVGSAIAEARKDLARPSIIVVKTQIAYGSPGKQGTADAHGAPLGAEEVCRTKVCLGCDPDDFFCVPVDALGEYRKSVDRGRTAEQAWQAVFDTYTEKHPQLAARWKAAMKGDLPEDWQSALPVFPAGEKPIATRAASGRVLNALSEKLPLLMGGSADLAPSNNTFLKGAPEFQKESYHGRNVRFGVREHAMAAVLTGMALHGGIRPYGGTFLVFADYMRPAIRLAAMMQQPVIYVFTHDSIAVGEDGPTHQPVEHLASLRAIPGLTVIRPADANETVEAWRQAILSTHAPVALVLSRQNLDVVDREVLTSASGLSKGAYILADGDRVPDLILVATGSEVQLALKAREVLTASGHAVRVVSMPSWELFEAMPEAYRQQVLPAAVSRRIVVEAGIAMGWERYAGSGGRAITMKGFGASAPGAIVQEKFGFTVDNIVETALGMLKS
ncbi:MAG: transketolase [Desulfobacterales bacterium]